MGIICTFTKAAPWWDPNPLQHFPKKIVLPPTLEIVDSLFCEELTGISPEFLQTLSLLERFQFSVLLVLGARQLQDYKLPNQHRMSVYGNALSLVTRTLHGERLTIILLLFLPHSTLNRSAPAIGTCASGRRFAKPSPLSSPMASCPWS